MSGARVPRARMLWDRGQGARGQGARVRVLGARGKGARGQRPGVRVAGAMVPGPSMLGGRGQDVRGAKSHICQGPAAMVSGGPLF